MYYSIGPGSELGNIGQFNTNITAEIDLYNESIYWSSTEYDSNSAWVVHFGPGTMYDCCGLQYDNDYPEIVYSGYSNGKKKYRKVRPIRSF